MQVLLSRPYLGRKPRTELSTSRFAEHRGRCGRGWGQPCNPEWATGTIVPPRLAATWVNQEPGEMGKGARD